MFAKLSSNFSNQEHFTDNAKLANKKKVEWKPNITYGTMLKWNLAKKKKEKRKEKSTKDNFRNLLMRFAEAIQSLLKIEMKWGTFLAVFLNILLGWIHLFSVWGFTHKCLFKFGTKRGYKILSQERKMKINFQTYPQRKIDFLTAHFEFAQKIHLRAATVHEVSLKIIA